MKPNYIRYLGIFVFALLCYFPLCLHLDSLPLRLWDEARRGVNTIELLDNGHWFIPYFDGRPDMWGTKPPLLIWLQAFFATVLGLSELSIRLPSVLAGVATVLLLVTFTGKVLRNPLAGYFAALVLLTSGIYINHHGPISGDYDALLTLWETAYLLSAYLYWSRQNLKWLYLTGLFILLAAWTKGAAGLFFVPGLCVFFLWKRSGRKIFRTGQFWGVAIATFLGILSYYAIREIYNPGFLAQVWDNELFGRYTEAKGNYNHDFWYYFKHIYREKSFFPWMYFLPLAFWTAWQSRSTRDIALLIGINMVLFYGLISSSATRLSWYCIPSFPLLALLVGIGLERLYIGLKMLLEATSVSRSSYTLLVLFVLTFFAYPYVQIVKRVYDSGLTPTEYYSEMYRDFIRNLPADEKKFTIFYDQYSAHPVFYRMFFNRKGYDLNTRILHPPRPGLQINPVRQEYADLSAGTKVMVCEKPVKQHLSETYQYETLYYFRNCELMVIKGKQ